MVMEKKRKVPFMLGGIALGILAFGALMIWRVESKTNKVALADAPKRVTVVEAKQAAYRASRSYVGTIEPWVEAKIGPQLVAAYVDTVLVRPGAVVKKGDVLATLDCRNASATSQAVAMQARALEAHQSAVAHEATRVQGLLDGGFVSANEAEQKTAQSASEQAQLLATQAKLLGTALEVSDCVLRSPFEGEVSMRTIDPGAFVRPGVSIVSVVDRTVLRITADAPESDFDVIKPNTVVKVHVLSTNKDLVAKVSRRAPAADAMTRTVHFELDVPDPERSIPVGTTGELRIEVGEPISTVEVPLSAASVRGSNANVYVVEGEIAKLHVIPIKGELAGKLYLDIGQLPVGSLIVTEGRALLNDGDKVTPTIDRPVASSPVTKQGT